MCAGMRAAMTTMRMLAAALVLVTIACLRAMVSAINEVGQAMGNEIIAEYAVCRKQRHIERTQASGGGLCARLHDIRTATAGDV